MEIHLSNDDPELNRLLTLRSRVDSLVHAINGGLTVLSQIALPDSKDFQAESPNLMASINDSVDNLPSLGQISISHLSKEQRAELKVGLQIFVDRLKRILRLVKD